MRLIVLIISLGLLYGCASQSVPDGGPRDLDPPVLTGSVPMNNQVNFSSSSIELTFNEAIILNNPKEQIIITPGVGKDFQVSQRKNRVSIHVDHPWLPNTTYTINFREAIQDITEKNPAENLKLAFSTGTYIDSLVIKGMVYDALSGVFAGDILVGVLMDSDTANIFKQPPLYFTKSDKTGAFRIENLKSDKYFLYAFDDRNKNLLVESATERYGFIPLPVALDSNLSDATIQISKANIRPLRVVQNTASRFYSTLRLSSNARSFTVRELDSVKTQSVYGENQSQIKIYRPNPSADSSAIRFIATDSLSREIDTTLYIRNNPASNLSEAFTYVFDPINFNYEKRFIDIKATFSKPVMRINFDSLNISIDSASRYTVVPSVQVDTVNKTFSFHITLSDEIIQRINTSKEKADSIKKIESRRTTSLTQFQIGKGAYISIDGDSSQSKSITINIINPETQGVIIAQVDCTGQYFIQLLNGNDKVIREEKNSSTIRFEDLIPGSYKLRVLQDLNTNGFWDPVNYLTRTNSEPVIYYQNEKGSQSIPLKANWEYGPALITCP